MAFTEDRYFFIRSRLNDSVLDIEGGNLEEGAAVITWHKKSADEGQDNQLWYEDKVTNTIRSKANDMCITRNDDDNIEMHPVVKHIDEQLWFAAGDRIQALCHAKRVINCSEEVGEQVNVVKNKPIRYFLLASVMNGKCVTVSDGNPKPGAYVVMFERHKGDNQQWFQGRDGFLRSKLNGLVLDCADGEITLQPYNPSSGSQGWCLSGEGRIALNVDNEDEVVLDIKEASDDDGATLIGCEEHGGDNQRWIVEYI